MVPLPFGYLTRGLERGGNISWHGADGTVHHGPVAIFEATNSTLSH